MDQTETTRMIRLLREAIDAADTEGIRFVYDGDSDTLLIHLFGKGLPAVSLRMPGDVMVRYDRVNDRVVGIHVEHFLADVVPNHPRLVDLLGVAELRDMPEDARRSIPRPVTAERRSDSVKRLVRELTKLAAAA